MNTNVIGTHLILLQMFLLSISDPRNKLNYVSLDRKMRMKTCMLPGNKTMAKFHGDLKGFLCLNLITVFAWPCSLNRWVPTHKYTLKVLMFPNHFNECMLSRTLTCSCIQSDNWHVRWELRSILHRHYVIHDRLINARARSRVCVYELCMCMYVCWVNLYILPSVSFGTGHVR